ncbi:hypothetical protein PQX77_015726 [Marasmius sp. AFHP31]|nr:hypothetical protein PQX77_015726 [Marasmius sp. AFHP31]
MPLSTKGKICWVEVPPFPRELEDAAWVLFQGARPGVYYNRSDLRWEEEQNGFGGLARAYDTDWDAQRAFNAYKRCGIIDLMNEKVVEGERFVVTEGYKVGIYEDRESALMVGLRWDPGMIVKCRSLAEANSYFKQKLLAKEVVTKIEHIYFIPTRMFPEVRRYTYKVETSEENADPM